MIPSSGSGRIPDLGWACRCAPVAADNMPVGYLVPEDHMNLQRDGSWHHYRLFGRIRWEEGPIGLAVGCCNSHLGRAVVAPGMVGLEVGGSSNLVERSWGCSSGEGSFGVVGCYDGFRLSWRAS